MKKDKIILCLDVGLKRIGVAKSVLGIPLCLEPIFRKNRNQAARDVRSVVMESKAEILVVGIPKDSSDSSSDSPILAMQRRIRHFVSLLELPSEIEVVFIDESFSSFQAMEKLDDKKMRKKANLKSGSLDSMAALVILERYLMS
ncbi:MAG: Holliday junction resolvase RuvX [Helicobacter sp.]|nr:Holliday junction resolvase RuvX [Helicobacteraceae bacterium]MDY3113987.1 Holliday junction resolvase RuvX [Helicobacter sp.]